MNTAGMGTALALITLLAGCSADAAKNCGGSVSSVTQDGTTLTASGDFTGGQPILRMTVGGSNNEIAADTYDASTASFDISGIAPGTYTVSWIISCNEGGEQNLNGSKVTSITLH